MHMCTLCRQEVVLIGTNLDKARVRAQLDGCLLSDEELAAGPEQWAEFDDPFPESHSHDHEHEHEHDENCDHDHSHEHSHGHEEGEEEGGLHIEIL